MACLRDYDLAKTKETAVTSQQLADKLVMKERYHFYSGTTDQAVWAGCPPDKMVIKNYLLLLNPSHMFKMLRLNWLQVFLQTMLPFKQV